MAVDLFLMDLRGIPPAAPAAFQASSASEGPPDLQTSADFVCSLLVRFPSSIAYRYKKRGPLPNARRPLF